MSRATRHFRLSTPDSLGAHSLYALRLFGTSVPALLSVVEGKGKAFYHDDASASYALKKTAFS